MQKVRILSYDIFRGILLIGMVVFHIIVNLTSLNFNQELFYWVPLGFVLLLGVILAKFMENKSLGKIKLAIKLLAIFLIGNIPNFLHKDINLNDFIIGNSEIFSFEILIPMILVILITLFFTNFRKNKLFLSILFFLLIFINYPGVHSYNLLFTIYGLIGYFIGSAFNLNPHPGKKRLLIPVFVFSVIPFLIIQYFQLFDFLILIQVLSMYFLFNFLFENNQILAILGQYSLFLYVTHIVLLKSLSAYYQINYFVEFIGFSLFFITILYLMAWVLKKRNLKLL